MMLKSYKIFCPNLNKFITLEIYIKKHKKGQINDALYILDGQNAFKDKDATFKRSLRFTKYVDLFKDTRNINICAIAIKSYEDDIERTNEYLPYKFEINTKWNKNQNLSISKAFTNDFINTIIPFINAIFNINDSYIFGASLGALYASFIANNYTIFKGCGLFSICPFLCEKAFYKDLSINKRQKLKTFIYVGKNEESDSLFDKDLYLNSALKLYDFLNNDNTRLLIDENGVHNEESWEKHIIDFLSFIYSNSNIKQK